MKQDDVNCPWEQAYLNNKRKGISTDNYIPVFYSPEQIEKIKMAEKNLYTANLKKDIDHLEEMKQSIDRCMHTTDIVEMQHLQTLIEDWLDELKSKQK